MARLDPHSFAQDNQPRTRAWDLVLDADFDARVLRGRVTLTFHQPSSAGPLDLDTRHLLVDRVVDPAGSALPFALDETSAVLGTRLRITLPAGLTSVTVHYRTHPDASALQWLTPAQTAGKAHPYLFSQCQAIHARSMVPCQDTPSVRVTYTARLTVPAALTAVMAAAMHGPEDPLNGRRTFRFHMPQAIPPYLLALAVGDLAQKDLSPRSRVYAEPSVLDRAASEFSGVDAMMTAAEGLFGPYPWDRFDMLVMPPSFPYGGMENPRLTFLTPTLLAGDRSLVSVVVHELSHSWTGNLVTNTNAEHFWLNEGFTVYAERRILEVLEGKPAVALHAAMGLAGLREDMARLGAEGPLTALRTHLDNTDPDEVYSHVPYEKGCLFLTRIEQVVGRQRFDAFLRTWLAAFAFKAANTEDFLTHLRAQLAEVFTALDVDTWVNKGGLPPDTPLAHSARLEELTAAAQAFPGNPQATLGALKAFGPNDWQVFLPRLPANLSTDACALLDQQFGLSRHGNMEIRVAFLTACVRAGHAPAYAMVEDTLRTVGRMKYLRPLYTALRARPDTLALARRVFASAEGGYHPVARQVMEGVLRG